MNNNDYENIKKKLKLHYINNSNKFDEIFENLSKGELINFSLKIYQELHDKGSDNVILNNLTFDDSIDSNHQMLNNLTFDDSIDSNDKSSNSSKLSDNNKPNNKTFRSCSLRSRELDEIKMTDLVKLEKKNGYFRINNYTLIDKIGQGSYGKVYQAIDENNNIYAIKVINKINNKLCKYELQNIQKEIAIMKKLRHKNIVSLYEVIDDPTEKRVYIVMQYIENGPIMIRNSDDTYNILPENKIKIYIYQLTAGLQYLHNHEIIHRDIKPENILVDLNDNVYLVDFGVSENLCDTNMETSLRTGTILFFAPELFNNDNKSMYGPAIDIWALGVTIFIMLYGYVPFDGDTFFEIKKTIINEDPKYPQSATKIQKDFLNKILCKNVQKRSTISGIRKHPYMRKIIKKLKNINNTTHLYNLSDDEINKAISKIVAYSS
jgi:serine/threonine protein kinase